MSCSLGSFHYNYDRHRKVQHKISFYFVLLSHKIVNILSNQTTPWKHRPLIVNIGIYEYLDEIMNIQCTCIDVMPNIGFVVILLGYLGTWTVLCVTFLSFSEVSHTIIPTVIRAITGAVSSLSPRSTRLTAFCPVRPWCENAVNCKWKMK